MKYKIKIKYSIVQNYMTINISGFGYKTEVTVKNEKSDFGKCI